LHIYRFAHISICTYINTDVAAPRTRSDFNTGFHMGSVKQGMSAYRLLCRIRFRVPHGLDTARYVRLSTLCVGSVSKVCPLPTVSKVCPPRLLCRIIRRFLCCIFPPDPWFLCCIFPPDPWPSSTSQLHLRRYSHDIRTYIDLHIYRFTHISTQTYFHGVPRRCC
jgi:hypothetical protein